MAIIYNYPQATPKATDLLIGTVTYEAGVADPIDGNPTRQFTIGDVAELVSSYVLSSQASGTNATLVLTNDLGNISAVNLIRGTGISIVNAGTNSVTIGNLGVLSVSASNTNYITMTPSATSTGAVVFSAALSASGTAGATSYLRGDNTWFTPVNTVSTTDSTFINLTPTAPTNGTAIITASLSATGTPTNLTFLRGDNTWTVPAGGGTVTSVIAGTGIAVDNTNPNNPIISNTGILSNIAGTGILVTTASGNSTITNDGVLSVTSADTNLITIGGTAAAPTVTANTSTIVTSGTNLVTSGVIFDYVAAQGYGSMSSFNISDEYGNIRNISDSEYVEYNAGGGDELIVKVTGLGTGGNVNTTLNLAGLGVKANTITTDDYIVFAGANDTPIIGFQYKVKPSDISLSFFAAPTVDLSIGSNKLTNVLNPTLAQDAATKNYVDNVVVGGLIYQGGYDASSNVPILDNRGTQIAITKGWTYTVTVDGTFYSETVKIGDVLIAETDIASGSGSLTDWTTVQSNIDVATATVQGIASFPIAGGLEVVTGAVSMPDLVGLTPGSYTTSNITVDAKGRVTAVATGAGGVTSIIAGTNVTISPTDGLGDVTINSDDTVYTAGAGISIDGSKVITNTDPDQTVVITGSGGATVTGTYPSFNISTTNEEGVESVVAGTAISINNTDPANPIVTNTSPDQTVVLSGGDNITITGTYPNFTIASDDPPAPLVTSVNTQIGAVVLDTDDISEGSINLYDKVVSITGTGIAVASGTYPNFSIDVPAGAQSVMAKDSFVGDGVTTQYQLSLTPTSATYTEVFLSGIYQEASTYTLSTDTITLSAPPDNGDTLEIITFNLGTTSGGGGIDSVQAGTNVTIDNTDPANPIISSTASGGGGATSLNDLSDAITVTSGYRNMYVGPSTGLASGTGEANLGVGTDAFKNITTGNNNVGLGLQTLLSVTSGNYNIGAGTNALYSVTTGSENVGIGGRALLLNNNNSNVAVGFDSQANSTSGTDNVSMGRYSLSNLVSGSWNTAIGDAAGINITGSGNVVLGTSSSSGTISPAFNITSENDRVSIGSMQTTNAYINVGWTVVSDERDKIEFAEIPHGLEFVKNLKPVSYKRRKQRDSDEAWGTKKYGFKAQDILSLEGEDAVVIDASDENILRYNESSLIPILVKAIQDLEKEIEILKNK